MVTYALRCGLPDPRTREAEQLLQAQEFFVGCQWLGIDPVPEQDWVRLTQSQFTPVEIER